MFQNQIFQVNCFNLETVEIFQTCPVFYEKAKRNGSLHAISIASTIGPDSDNLKLTDDANLISESASDLPSNERFKVV